MASVKDRDYSKTVILPQVIQNVFDAQWPTFEKEDEQKRNTKTSRREGGVMSEVLKCVITITGKKGEGEAKINLEFDPPILKEGEKQWDDSGAEIILGYVMEALREAKDRQG